MKSKLLFTLAVAFFSFSAFAQDLKESEVPAPVKAAFAKLYPNVKDVDWEKENSNYEAEFEVNKTESSVVFDAKGNLLETEIEINVSELPKSASEYVAKKYPKYKIAEASKIIDATGAVTYEAAVGDTDLIFDSNGLFIKEVIEAKDIEKDQN